MEWVALRRLPYMGPTRTARRATQAERFFDVLNGQSRMVALGAALQALAFVRSSLRYRALPEIGPTADRVADGTQAEDCATVSVIIPARNEAARLPALLHSLSEVNYTTMEVLVVDDGSSDGTAAVAESLGFQCLRLAGPPGSWTGKNWACWNGSLRSKSEWLLFLDADVRLTPQGLGLALDWARQTQSDLFSLLLRQRCVTFWEKLLLPYAYCMYFVGGGGPEVNESPSRAVANGQFMLARREAYVATGGHSSVSGSVVDDVAMARRFKDTGFRVGIARGEACGDVRMYEGLRAIRSGFAKNAVQFSLASPGGLLTILASLVCFSLAVAALRKRGVWLLTALAENSMLILPWYRRFGASPFHALLHPLAALVFQAIAIESVIRKGLGLNTWSGRRLP